MAFVIASAGYSSGLLLFQYDHFLVWFVFLLFCGIDKVYCPVESHVLGLVQHPKECI